MLVIDASVAVDFCLSKSGFDEMTAYDLVAPPLIRAETLSTLHELRWRSEIPDEMADLGRARHRQMPIRIEHPSALDDEAWRVADEFGWAKVYDAHYVALARLLGCRLLTIDEKLRRGADRLGLVITPEELNPKPPTSPDGEAAEDDPPSPAADSPS